MEVKINREIRNYTESMFFGLSIQTSALLHAALMTGIFLLGSAVAALRITSINVMNLMKVED